MPKSILDTLDLTSDPLTMLPDSPEVKKTSEVFTLAGNIQRSHHKAAISIACVWLITASLLDHYATARGVDLQSVKATLWDALALLRDQQGLTRVDVSAALAGLQQAGETAAYLSSLPD